MSSFWSACPISLTDKSKNIELTEVCAGSYLLSVPEIDVSWVFNPWPDISKFLIKRDLPFNGVVCPDTRIQNGVNCNLIEFPLLYVLFAKGMIFRGEKPYLIGTRFQIQKNCKGFKRSLFAYFKSDEMKGCDLSESECNALMSEIEGLTFNGIQNTRELIKTITLKPLEECPDYENATNIKGLKIWKSSGNVFDVEYKGERHRIDCNLKTNEIYHPPLKIDVKNIPLTQFQVIDTGEEDGFSQNSCMHTVVQWRDKIICVDLPMNVKYLLEKISISRFEIDSVIFTHCHDDHIGDIPTLMQLGKKVKVFCPKIIWKSILHKASCMMYMDPAELATYFDYQPLEYGKEFNYSGLRILAFPSIHSVPCSIYRIRGMVKGEWKTYTHLSDILNLKRAKLLLKEKFITQKRYDDYKNFLLAPADIKKIDVGAVTGTEEVSVHGHWKDFINDKSKHIILGHITGDKLDDEAKVLVGQLAVVGSARDLSEGLHQSYVDKYVERAIKYLDDYLFNLLIDRIKKGEITREKITDSVLLFANQEIRLIQPNTPFLKIGQNSTFVDMVVSGIGSIWAKTENGMEQKAIIQAGDVIGDMGVLENLPRNASIKAETYMRVLRIPGHVFRDEMINLGLFVPSEAKGTFEKECLFKKIWRNRELIQSTSLFSKEVPVYLQNKIAQWAVEKIVQKGDTIYQSNNGKSMVIAPHGTSMIANANLKSVEDDLTKIPVFGEEHFIQTPLERYHVKARNKTRILVLPAQPYDWINEIPIFKLRLKELNELRALFIKRATR